VIDFAKIESVHISGYKHGWSNANSDGEPSRKTKVCLRQNR